MAKNKKNRVLNFFKDVKSELKKVTWPSFKQVRNNTLIVIVSVLIIGAFIWILDALFGFAWKKVIDIQKPAEQVEQTTTTEGTTSEIPLNNLPVEMNIPSTDGQSADGNQQTEPSTQNPENKPQQ